MSSIKQCRVIVSKNKINVRNTGILLTFPCTLTYSDLIPKAPTMYYYLVAKSTYCSTGSKDKEGHLIFTAFPNSTARDYM